MTINWNTRAEKPLDIPTVHQITLAAFETDQEAVLLEKLRNDPAWIPELSFIGETPSGEVVAHAILSRCLIDEAPALLLGPVSVLPSHQNQGAGTAVITALLEEAARQGEPHVVLVGHPNYYPRFGFLRASDFRIRFTLELPDEVVMAMTLDLNRPLPSGVVHPASPFPS